MSDHTFLKQTSLFSLSVPPWHSRDIFLIEGLQKWIILWHCLNFDLLIPTIVIFYFVIFYLYNDNVLAYTKTLKMLGLQTLSKLDESLVVFLRNYCLCMINAIFCLLKVLYCDLFFFYVWDIFCKKWSCTPSTLRYTFRQILQL